MQEENSEKKISQQLSKQASKRKYCRFLSSLFNELHSEKVEGVTDINRNMWYSFVASFASHLFNLQFSLSQSNDESKV